MLDDDYEEKRRVTVRRKRWRYERGCRVRGRACDDKRWAWQRRVWAKYHLAAWDIAKKWDAQEGLCPICAAPLETKTWVIDHDHRTERFRGILCAWCNHRVLSMAERGGRERALRVLLYLGWANTHTIQALL